MKVKVYVLLLAICLATGTMFAQQMMKPSVMVVPSNAWCQANGYMKTNGGTTYPDYQTALNSSMELVNVISKINILMSDRGFPLQNLETALKNLSTSETENEMIQSKESGAMLQEDVLDMLYRQAQADIILQLTWNVNTMGPRRSITFNLQALDSYTAKQVAGAQGTGTPSFSAEIPVLLEEAVIDHMDSFCNRLMEHFTDIQQNGREITLDIRLFDTAGIDFETEYDDYELAEIITRWIAQNSVNHRFSRGPSTANMLQFRDVRIPVVDSYGMPMDAYAFARDFARFFKKEPYNIPSKVLARGLGKAVIVLGEK